MAMKRRGNATVPLTPAGFALARIPLFPGSAVRPVFEGLAAPSASGGDLIPAAERDRERMRDFVRERWRDPSVRAAIWIASPDLARRFDLWAGGHPGSGARVEEAALSYLLRMSCRPTPFGLFSACALAHVGGGDEFRIGSRESIRRRTRLDSAFLARWLARFRRGTKGPEAERLTANETLYRAAGKWRFAARPGLPGTETGAEEVAVRPSGPLDRLVAAARRGLSFGEAVDLLVAEGHERKAAEAFVRELVDCQLLQPEARPCFTGRDPQRDLAARLAGAGSDAGRVLARTLSVLDRIDAAPLVSLPAACERLRADLRSLSGGAEDARFVRADSYRTGSRIRLGEESISRIAGAIRLLHRTAPEPAPTDLDRFRDAFVERYGRERVPLLAALDAETGLLEAFAGPRPAAAGWIGELPIAPGSRAARRAPWGPREEALLDLARRAWESGAAEIELDERTIARMEAAAPRPLPPSLAALVAFARPSGRAPSILFRGASGPTGARLLARFAALDGELERHLGELARREEELWPGVLLAEVVHDPGGSAGNVLERPALRRYEIPCLAGRGGSPQVLPLDDLLVSVEEGRVVLHSRRHGREVVPLLSSAHHVAPNALPVYRFLTSLAAQDLLPGVAWDWGPVGSARWLPRVVWRGVVLARARWTVARDDWEAWADQRGASLIRRLRSWRERRGLPRRVVIAEFDHELPIDFENVLLAELFARTARSRGRVELREWFPPPDRYPGQGPDGAYAVEAVVPFFSAPRPARAAPPRPAPAAVTRRCFAPGSEWITLKFYAGPSSAEDLLLREMAPAARALVASRSAACWFFVRYADPDPHVRLRVRALGPDVAQAQEVLLRPARRALEDGGLVRVALDTYRREIERYGGAEAIERVERFFGADSDAAVDLLEILRETGRDSERWLAAFLSVGRLLAALGFEAGARAALAGGIREGAARFLPDAAALRRALASRLREERGRLERLLAGEAVEDWEAGMLAILERRDEAARRLGLELRSLERSRRLSCSVAEIAASLAHMAVNRIMRDLHRACELVVGDFLGRIETSRAARAPATAPRAMAR
ncbi:MAG: hypothetical protein D6718_11075 [Acidobacteria bacterium]|nr:MAG: hypothetical protein D6718_11075 [Acidobacteriota bacterium]